MNAPRTTLIFLAAGLVALGVGLWAGARTGDRPAAMAATESTVVLPSPRPLADFLLVRDNGAPFTREQFRGHWSLLFAGFTHCPDVCPTTLGVMSAVARRLPADAAEVQMVFLSVDPDRDTPTAIRQYVRYFSPAMVGITGPAPELDKLTAAVGLAYMKVAGASPAEYSVDHSASLALIDPQARIAAYFQPPHRAEAIATDLAKIVGTVAACPGLEIEDGWIRAVPPGSGMTAGYARLHNRGSAPVRIEGVSSPAFGDASLHRTTLEDGSYQMTPVEAVELAPGASVPLEPNGMHLMLMQPGKPLREGDQVPVSFRCGPARSTAAFTVRAGGP